MPLWEFTIARSGPAARSWSIAARAPSRTDSSRLVDPGERAPRPLFGDRPASASTPPYWANRVGKKARTAWPKRIGSETFIIVALVQGEEHALLLRRGDLLAQEGLQRRDPHDGGVDDLAGQHRHGL